jgi:hypothetical protein
MVADVHTVTTDAAVLNRLGVLARASGRRGDPWPVAWLTVDEVDQRFEELGPTGVNLAVSVITITILFSVITPGASATGGWCSSSPHGRRRQQQRPVNRGVRPSL